MSKILDLGLELLKTFLAPKEELEQTAGLTEKNLKAFLERKGISDFLLYRYYEEKKKIGIYHLADGRKGFILRVFPSSMNSISIEKSIYSLVDTLKKNGTIIHINTFASRNISHLTQNYKEIHHCNVNVDNVSILKEVVDDTYDFMVKGAESSVLNNIDFRIRDFVSTISILFPLNTTENEIFDIYNNILGNLRDINPINFSGSSLISLLKEMLNPDGKMNDWSMDYNQHMIMNKQISSSGTKVTTKENKGDFYVGEEWKYRTLTTSSFPDDKKIVTSYDFYNLFFDRFGENIQIPIPCPFFTSLVIVVKEGDFAKEKALAKSRDDMRKVKKIKKDIVDEQPELSGRLKEAKRNILLIDGEGQTPLDAMWSITIMEKDEAKLEKYSSVIKARFKTNKKWDIEEERFGNIALFVFLYSLPLQHHYLVETFLKRFDILFTSNTAAIAPLLGNISSSRMLIPYMDRNGQLVPYDNFNGDNYNEFKTGGSGAGKSYSQAFSHIQKLAAGIKQRVIDNGHSYKRFCEVIGGTYIDVGKNASISMNFYTKANTAKVLDANGEDSQEEILIKDSSGQLKKTLHKEELAGIVPIIGLMLGLDFVATGKEQNSQDATDESFLSSKISQAVIETFIRHQHNGKLEHTREIFKEYYEEEKSLDNEHHAKLLYSCYAGLFDYADPKGSEYIKFNTPDNLDLTKDYVVLDTLGLRGKLLDIITVSLAFKVKSEFWKEGIKRQKALDIDEGWNFKDKPLVIKILEDNARTFRKSKSGQCFITQGIEDAMENNSMLALFQNAYHKFLLSQDEKAIKKIAEGSFFPLSAYEERLFKSVRNKKPYWGEALHVSQKTGSNVSVIKTSPKAHWLCAGADPDGNTLFDNTKTKYNLTDIETVRFLAFKDKNNNLPENDLLYHAKNYSEKNNLNEEEEKRYWKEELKNAIEENRFMVKFEEISNFDEKKDKKRYECFMQLRHHDETISSFPKFIKYAKDFNFEDKIFEIMLTKCFIYFEDKEDIFHINLNTDEIRSIPLMRILKDKIEQYNVKGKLVLELKETDTNQNIDELKEFIDTFQNKGIEIALDNVGLHYHKMAYIFLLNCDLVKIEGELINDSKTNDGARRALELIIALCKEASNKKIIATRVESQEEFEFLKKLNFDLYQGFVNKEKTIFI